MCTARFTISTLLLVTLFTTGCARETKSPDASTAAVPDRETSKDAPSPAATPRDADASYDAALDWLRSTSGFQFTLRDGEVSGEGELRRTTIGAESMTLRTADGVEWRATTTQGGVVWERREAGGWRAAPEPAFGNRVYQRLTIPFDPQKKEGAAQLVASDANTNRYRFTDANSGRVHELHVSRQRGDIERMTIGDDVDIRFSPSAQP